MTIASHIEAESTLPPAWKSPLWLLLVASLLLVTVAALYRPVLGFEFLTYDDSTYILEDPAIQELNWSNFKTILLEPYVHTWYPLARLSAALDIMIFGHQASGHHLVNVVLHFLNAFLLYILLVVLAQRLVMHGEEGKLALVCAFLSSLLFAVHPQHVEAVAWVVQRKELLATFFSLLSVLAFLRRRSSLCVISLLLAMLSKPTAVAVPVFLLLLEFILLDDRSRFVARLVVCARHLWKPLLMSLLFALITLANQEGLESHNALVKLETRLVLFADNTLRGISDFIRLQAGSFHQPMRDYVSSGSWLGWLSVLVLLFLLGSSLAMLIDRRVAVRASALGILFYVSSLLPTGGLVLFGNYAFGDRYLYLGSVGLYLTLFVVLLALMRRFSEGVPRSVLIAISGLYIAVALALAAYALPRWSSTWTLWEDNVRRHPDSVLVNYSLGHYHFVKKEYDLALKHFDMTIQSRSEPFRVSPRVQSALYMAQIFCVSGEEGAAGRVLSQVPQFGEISSRLEQFLSGLERSGYKDCHESIQRWRGTSGR